MWEGHYSGGTARVVVTCVVSRSQSQFAVLCCEDMYSRTA